MDRAVYAMEMRRHLKSFLIWAGSVGAILFFGMLFFPAINADGLLDELDVLFENPMMKGVTTAFGVDFNSLGSLTGFYVTYNSLYNVLLGCIFASVLAGSLLAREEADRTGEFLFTKPLSRRSVFLSKSAVLFTYLTLFALVYFSVSLLALETVKGEAPDGVYLSRSDRALIVGAVETHPDRIYDAFALTEESFDRFALSFASDLLAASPGEAEDMNMDPADLERLIEEAARGPEAFFDRVLEDPETYMALFSFPAAERDAFLANVRGEREEYRRLKADFFNSPGQFLLFFEADPALMLEPLLDDPAALEKAARLLGLPGDLRERITGKYSVRKIGVLCFYVWLLILAMGSLVLFLSLLLKRGRSILGGALGLVFFFYFLHSLSQAAAAFSPAARFLGYLSPFSWMDTDFARPGYGLDPGRALSFLGLAAASLAGAYGIFRRKDILL